jgi:hypothetical protein
MAEQAVDSAAAEEDEANSCPHSEAKRYVLASVPLQGGEKLTETAAG